ncbi:MAG TPA: prolyl oligopeptidase family serine peptidase [Candidatus Limnocylindrales bacterium]|nr:prolyl oligopeptidase family serine peptidase [Candidatus Limnocylindrales bacterium]
MTELPAWEARYRAPIVTFPSWSRHAPDRLVHASTESGVYQLHSWDIATGERRRITNDEVGVLGGQVTPDGAWISWHQDSTGDESGRHMVAPFDGGPAEPLLEGAPKGWDEGIAIGRERTVAAISNADGFGVWVSERGGPARRIALSPESIRLAGGEGLAAAGPEVGGLSADETLVCVAHSEHGDMMHAALRVLDARTGRTVADLRDEGLDLLGYAWSPVAGDQRIAIAHERRGERQPAIWNAATGELRELPLLFGGRVTEPVDWWPDASGLLLVELVEGRHRLHRYDLATGEVSLIRTRPGSITGARVRPDGSVWYRVQSGETPGIVVDAASDRVLIGPATVAPAQAAAAVGRPFIPWSFRNRAGQTVHGFRVVPEGPAPHPTMFLVHGGPTWLDLDRWFPDLQAYVDAGFQVALVNYRGSIGFGREWRDWLIGNIGWPEVEDVLAGYDDLLHAGLLDPARSVIAGWSWGGYITLLMHGMHPERFVAGVAGVPVGDYAAGYEDLSPTLQAYDRALLGGTPDQVPQLMAERSPISYVDRVQAPILFLAGERDTRCPLRQVMLYVDRLRARNHPHELYLFPTGHAPYQIDEKVRQTAVVLDFLARMVPGIRRLPGVDEHLDEALGRARAEGPMAGRLAAIA